MAEIEGEAPPGDMVASQPATQPATQSQASQPHETSEAERHAPPLPRIWGRLYPAPPAPVTRTLGLRATPQPHHNFTTYIDLTKRTFKLGRSSQCDFSITTEYIPMDIITKISLEHFLLIRNIDEPMSPVIIHDLSSNGTFINGVKIGKGNKRILVTNDEISIFSSALRVFIFMDLFKNDQEQVPKIISDKYYISRHLGMGACGVVKLVYNKTSCMKYALKIITKKKLGNGHNQMNDSKKIMNEVTILKAIRHPFIITTEEIIDTPEAVYIVLELMEGGELFDLISKNGNLGEHISKMIFRQMILAVKHLHKQGVTHRDLKPENVLLESLNLDMPLVKITDFGLSKFVSEDSVMRTMCGTPYYVAPEVLLSEGKNHYSSQVDVWSLGVILFICLSGYHPFSPEYKHLPLREQIITGKFMYSRKHWHGVSVQAQQLIKKMLVVNPDQRITVDNILKDPWMLDDKVIAKVDEHVNKFKSIVQTRTNIITTESVALTIKRNLSEFQKQNDPHPKRRKIDDIKSDSSNENSGSSSEVSTELSCSS